MTAIATPARTAAVRTARLDGAVATVKKAGAGLSVAWRHIDSLFAGAAQAPSQNANRSLELTRWNRF